MSQSGSKSSTLIAFLSLPEQVKLLTMSRAETNLDAWKNQLKEIFGGIWMYCCTTPTQHGALGQFDGCTEQGRPKGGSHPVDTCSGSTWGAGGPGEEGLSRRFDIYCSLKWAAQPNAGHSLPAPARSAAVLALVKGLPRHLPSIKS